jgi:hypothetical protein
MSLGIKLQSTSFDGKANKLQYCKKAHFFVAPAVEPIQLTILHMFYKWNSKLIADSLYGKFH